MSNKEAWPSRFKNETYATDTVLTTKLSIHDQFSTIPIDLHAESQQKLNVGKNESLLDVGCGTGDFLVWHKRKFPSRGHLSGLDLNPGVFAEGQRTSKIENLGIQFIAGDARKLPFKDNMFDKISARHMLSHLPDVTQACQEIRRTMKDEGILLATANSLESYPHVAKYRSRAYELMGWGEPFFTTNVLNAENMEGTLHTVFSRVKTHMIPGELQIPHQEFIAYFNSNIDVWDNVPTGSQRREILHNVREWSKEDLVDGYIVEPKYVGVAIAGE